MTILTITEDPADTMARAGLGPMKSLTHAEQQALSDDDYDALESAQAAGEDDYFERWCAAAKDEAAKLGYEVRLIRAAEGSPESINATVTGDTWGDSVEFAIWQAAHDATALPEGW
jgi:hypothetical protein